MHFERDDHFVARCIILLLFLLAGGIAVCRHEAAKHTATESVLEKEGK